MENDLMVDIETLGTSHNAVITQIGACYFDRYTGLLSDYKTQFQVNIQIQDCLDKGLVIDGGALKFWFEQGTERMTWLKDPVLLSKALNDFREFSKKAKNVWSHATFDIPIIANAYKVMGSKLPFSYRYCRDIRTLVELSGIQSHAPRKDKTHTALEDCIYQVKYCVECFNTITAN